MLPEYQKHKNFEDLDSSTRMISFRVNEVSESFFAYVRKIFPKIITAKQQKNLAQNPFLAYELNLIQLGIDLLLKYGKQDLFKGTSLEEDLMMLESESEDYQMRFVLMHNIQRKKIYYNQLKIMKALLEIVVTIKDNVETGPDSGE